VTPTRPDSTASGGPTGRVLGDEAVAAAARALADAERTQVPMRQLSRQHPDMTVEDAYAIQRALIEQKLADGRRLVGRKIGLTSRAMQQSASIDEPDFGALLDDMIFENGAEIPARRFIRPRIEMELAFVLGEAVTGPGCTAIDILRAAEFVVPALEILDARVQMTDPETGGGRTIVDTIADNAADAGVVLGSRPAKPLEIDIAWVAALLYRNGVIEESGVAAAVLHHPANSAAWLANKLAGYGVRLEAGQIILSGSFIRPVHAYAGDVFFADYGPLGTITCRFAAEPPPAPAEER
jgi:2-oxo-hept-3-ene-1,7-dioate hydratase